MSSVLKPAVRGYALKERPITLPAESDQRARVSKPSPNVAMIPKQK